MDPEPRTPLAQRLRQPSERRIAREAQWRRLVGFSALAVVLIVGLILAKPTYQRLVRWRATSIVNQATELARQQLFPEAIEKLDAALRLDPTCTSGLRALSDLYTRFELPSALPVLKALVASPERTEADVRNFIDVALKLERFDLVEGELARLLGLPEVSNQTRILATEYYYRMGDMPRALEFANEIRRVDPTNNVSHLRAAKVMLNTPNTARQRDGVTLLLTLKNLSTIDRINIAEIIGSAPGLPPAQVQELLQLIPPDPGGNTFEFFLRSDARIRIQPAERPKLVAAAISRYRNGSTQEQTDLCNWLMRSGEHAALLQAYTPDDAIRIPAVLALYLEALGRLNRWSDIQRLTEGRLPLDSWQIDSLRAAAAGHLKQEALAQEHWRRAFETVSGNPARLRDLGDFALRLNAGPIAIKAYRQLMDNKLYRGSAHRRLAAIYQNGKDTQALREIMQAWAAGSDNPYAENTYCYLSALVVKDVESAYLRAEKLYKAMPKRLAFRMTLAFLEYRRGHPAEAMHLFDRAAIDMETSTPQTRLVQALILEANGQQAAAKNLVKDVKTDALLPEEQEIIRKIKGG